MAPLTLANLTVEPEQALMVTTSTSGGAGYSHLQASLSTPKMVGERDRP